MVEIAALAIRPAGEPPPTKEAPSPDAASPATIRLNGQKVTFVANGDTAIVDVPAGANVLAASA
jgi:hypothetical protein